MHQIFVVVVKRLSENLTALSCRPVNPTSLAHNAVNVTFDSKYSIQA